MFHGTMGIKVDNFYQCPHSGVLFLQILQTITHIILLTIIHYNKCSSLRLVSIVMRISVLNVDRIIYTAFVLSLGVVNILQQTK